MKRTIVLGLAILTLGATTAAAFEPNHRIDKRQDRQDWRIHHGIENGSLTKREVKQLRRETHQILRLEEMALSDGHLHPAEFEFLDDALDALSDRIYEAKHNDRYRVSYRLKTRKHRGHDRTHYDQDWHAISPDHGSYRAMAKQK
ncbi:MAG: hypothetical protein ACRBM6_35900 [Geminicoccales bacterium]